MRSAHHLTGTLQRPRAERDHDVLGIEARLHPEAAPHVADQNPHLFLRDAEYRLAQLVAQTGRRLAADGQREAVRRRVETRQHGARLDRTGRDALVDEVERHDVGGGAESRRRGFGATVAHFARDVSCSLRPHRGRARRDGIRDVHHHRQRLVTNFDRLPRIARRRDARRDHCGDGLPDKTNDSDRERVSRCGGGRRPVGAPEVGRQRHRPHPRAHEILAGHDGDHAGHCYRRRSVDGSDSRVGMR